MYFQAGSILIQASDGPPAYLLQCLQIVTPSLSLGATWEPFQDASTGSTEKLQQLRPLLAETGQRRFATRLKHQKTSSVFTLRRVLQTASHTHTHR